MQRQIVRGKQFDRAVKTPRCAGGYFLHLIIRYGLIFVFVRYQTAAQFGLKPGGFGRHN